MAGALSGRRVAVLVTNGFEQVELTEPRRRLTEQGAHVQLVSLKKDRVKAWNHSDWGDEFPVDLHIDEADPTQYDALILPGGVINSDLLRLDQRAVDFVTACIDGNKVVAAIGHGPWLLIEANRVSGRAVTSYLSLRTDLVNAGAEWQDAAVVVDGRLVLSRWPDDLDPFCNALVQALSASGDRSV
jgi:protease I